MRFSSRSKLSITVSLATLVVLVGAFAVYSVVGRIASHANAASSVTTFHGTLGTAKLVGSVTIGSLSTATLKAASVNSQSSTNPHVMPLRPRPRQGTNAATAANASIARPSVHGSKVAPGTLLQSFDGVNAIQNGQATNGFDLEPPDESIAVGNSYVLNFVNLTGAIYNKNGTVAAGPFPLAVLGGGGFFNADLNNIVSDPRAYYDAASHTWFALVWEDDYVNGQLGPAYIDLAVNSGNPVTGTWLEYKIEADDPTAAGCPCLPDFTILGVDAYNVYLLPNEFQNYGALGFNGSQIYVLAKSQLIAGNKTPNVVHFGGLSLAGVTVYHLQPANETSNAPAEYFMNSLDPNSTFDNRLGVWAMTNRNNVAKGVIPNLSATVITSEAYGFPVNAQTPPGVCACPALNGPLPTTGVVTPDFDALQEVQYINGYLYGALDTSINIPGDTGARDGVAWFKVSPSLNGQVISSSTKVANQGYVGAAALYLLYPHIQVASNGTIAIVVTYGGPATYLSAGYVVMKPGAKSFGPLQQAAAGADPDNGFTGTAPFGGVGRWGDYSAGQLDPSGSGIWFATQYIPNNGDQYANWGNRVFEVQS